MARKSEREFLIQKEFVRYVSLKYRAVLFCASAGGLHTSKRQAVNMKAAGYKKGYPDIAIFEPSGGFHGLFIELKKETDGRVSPEQKTWIRKLMARGYMAGIAEGLEPAIELFEKYIKNALTSEDIRRFSLAYTDKRLAKGEREETAKLS